MKKIPDNAKKVFEGVFFDVYHWDQEMYDGTMALFEALRKRDSVAIIAVTKEGIILNEEEQPRKEPFIGLPGGMCDTGDLPLESAKRELLEETGFQSSDWVEWFVSDPLNHAKIEWNNYFFIAKDCTKITEQKLDPGEKIKVTFVTFEELLELRHNPKARNKDLFPILEKTASGEEEKQKLKVLLGIQALPTNN